MKTTPTFAIPYLEDKDPMRAVPGIIRALAERVEAIIESTEVTP